MKDFGVFDIEAPGWDKFRIACYRNSRGAEEVFYSATALNNFIRSQRLKIFGHNCGGYDNYFLEPPASHVMTGSRMLRARIGEAEICDSYPIFLMSLASVGEAIGMKKFENKSNRIEELTIDETIDHCMNDCRILEAALTRHRDWISTFAHPEPRWPTTAGAAAIYVAEVLEPEGHERLAAQIMSVEEWFAHHEIATGARTELHGHGVIEHPIWVFDIKSSYPRSWLEGPIPMGPWKSVIKRLSSCYGYYFAHVQQNRRFRPVVAPHYRWQYDGSCWVNTEELELLYATGAKVDIQKGFECASAYDFGDRFVKELYARKQAGEPESKVTINSFHGKFGERLIRQNWYYEGGEFVADQTLNFPAWHQRPLIEGWVLARARIRLWKKEQELLAAGWETYYKDTDCLHTNCPPEKFPGGLGVNCGDFALEAFAKHGAAYVGPKAYALFCGPDSKHVEPWSKIRCKGLPAKSVSADIMKRAALGEEITVEIVSGLEGFSWARKHGWGPKAKTLSRTLRLQSGGKIYDTRKSRKRNFKWLQYRDY